MRRSTWRATRARASAGFLNATFGNAAELIIAIMALREGLHEVVKASLTGSIIGNILLVPALPCWPEDSSSGSKFNQPRRRGRSRRC